MPRPPRRGRWLALALAAVVAGCSGPAPPSVTTLTWYAGRARPAFDPDGPPDALRIALERHLSRGLLERDTTGRVVPGLADSLGCSPDSLTWRFRLREGLRFTDGTPVTSADLRAALVGGLGRDDHATRAWLLGAVRGVAQVRPGRALPPLGLETPDPRTLVVRLAAPDRRLLEKLAVPGVATPWRRRGGDWRDAVGVGPYRVLAADGVRELVLVAATPAAGREASLDTLRVRFGGGGTRARAALRSGFADALWPVPPGTLEQPLPRDWSLRLRRTDPPRRLLLVLRADVPPLTRASVRRSLAGAINREELLAAAGARGEALRRWPPGARRAFEWPRLETPTERAARRAAEPASSRSRRGGSGRPESHHLVLAFDADLAGGLVASRLQSQWERAGHYVDLRALRGTAAVQEALRPAAAQAQLVEAQAPIPGPGPELAALVLPLRGPAVGSFRTGWRTRDYDRAIASRGTTPEPDPDAVQAVLEEDRIVLPLLELPWRLALRNGAPPPVVHPADGPEWTRPTGSAAGARTR